MAISELKAAGDAGLVHVEGSSAAGYLPARVTAEDWLETQTSVMALYLPSVSVVKKSVMVVFVVKAGDSGQVLACRAA